MRGCTEPNTLACAPYAFCIRKANESNKASGHSQMILNQILAGYSQVHGVPEPAFGSRPSLESAWFWGMPELFPHLLLREKHLATKQI